MEFALYILGIVFGVIIGGLLCLVLGIATVKKYQEANDKYGGE